MKAAMYWSQYSRPLISAGENLQFAAKVATALERIAEGNLSNVKTVGNGVLEYKVDFGPGYRIYFGRTATGL